MNANQPSQGPRTRTSQMGNVAGMHQTNLTALQLMSVKWKNYKVIFRKANSISDPITDVQLPIIYDLLNDPGERWNLWEQSMDMGWVLNPVMEKIAQFRKSVAEYPNIEPGEDFRGYPKRVRNARDAKPPASPLPSAAA